jgi:hypothetical protein
MRKFLLTWYGITDFRASLGLENTEGPIAAALAAEPYSDVMILCYTRPDDIDACRELRESFATDLSAIRNAGQPSDWDTTRTFVSKYANTTVAHEHFAHWLRAKFQRPDSALQISFKSETLRELNDTEGIYACATRALDWVAQESGEKLVTLYLSPGTPVMAFVWAIAALAHPTLKKRLIASPVIGKPPDTIALPAEWLERHGTAQQARQAVNGQFDVTFHLFGEQRMPGLLGIRQFASSRHVFVNSKEYPATCMQPFLEGTIDELHVNPWDASAVREHILRYAETLPPTARIAVNVTGGTKLMFAGALAAARAIGAVPYYFDSRNQRVIFVDDFHSEALRPIESVETFLLLHGDGLKLSSAGEAPALSPDRCFLTETLWNKRNRLAGIYQTVREFRETCEPFQVSAAGLTCALDENQVATVKGANLNLRFPNWPDFAKYLTGGWFEEYSYLQFKPYEDSGLIMDLRMNVQLAIAGDGISKSSKWTNAYNELDLVFTDGFSLYIVECKAGNVTQDQVMKLQNLVRFYGGVEGEGIVASCYKPDATTSKKMQDAGLVACFADSFPQQVRVLMDRIAARTPPKQATS